MMVMEKKQMLIPRSFLESVTKLQLKPPHVRGFKMAKAKKEENLQTLIPDLVGLHKATNSSPNSNYSHIHDENRGRHTNCNREEREEVDIASDFFNVFDPKQLVKECVTHIEHENRNKEDRETVDIDHQFCNCLDSKQLDKECGILDENEDINKEDLEQLDIDCELCGVLDSKQLFKECGYNARFVSNCTVNAGTTGTVATKTVESGDISKVVNDFDYSHEDNVIGFEVTKNSYLVGRSNNVGVVRGSLDCSNVDEYVVGEGNSIASRRVIHDVHDDTHNDNADDDMDPDYKIFIEKLRENGNSYILELLVSDGVVHIISYDTYDEQYGSGIAENTKTMVDFQMNNQRKESDARSSSRRRKVETQRTLRNVPGRGGKSSVAEEKVKGNVVDPILCELKDNLRTRPLPEVLDSINSKFSEQNLAVVDETYQNFLNGVKVEGSYFVFTFENGKEIIYGKDEESSMDSEVNEMDVDPFSEEAHTPFVTSTYRFDERDGCIENSVRKSCFQFRKGVMEVLRKPFDEKEYHDLFLKATLERKMVRDKELRSGPKQFQLPGRGKSYLDQHRDLAEKIDSFGNSKPKVLNLLRGFFYYLQNVAHNGVFQPWLEPACLEVLPQ